MRSLTDSNYKPACWFVKSYATTHPAPPTDTKGERHYSKLITFQTKQTTAWQQNRHVGLITLAPQRQTPKNPHTSKPRHTWAATERAPLTTHFTHPKGDPVSKQERATRTRHALIESAAYAFDQDGYSQARLDLISQRAGVSRGALFFHFANKEALADAVESAASSALHATTYGAYRERSSALQALIDSTHALARLLSQDQVVRGGFQINCDSTRAKGEDLRSQWALRVNLFLQKAAAQRELTTATPQRDMADTIVAATTGFQVLGRDDATWMSPSSLTRFWMLLLPRLATPEALAGLRAEGSERPPMTHQPPTDNTQTIDKPA